MKRFFAVILLLCLLTGCTARTEPAQPETEAPTQETVDEQKILVGTWRNEGQYNEGHDFVETMTLDAGGLCTVHLEYQGADYQTLEGTYIVSDGLLYTTLKTGNETVQRNFRYTLEGRELTLETNSKTVIYTKVD